MSRGQCLRLESMDLRRSSSPYFSSNTARRRSLSIDSIRRALPRDAFC